MKIVQIISFFYIAFISFHIQATLLVQGNATDQINSFTVPIASTVFDQPTATFYVGLQAGGDTYALSKATHQLAREDITAFTPIASSSTIKGLGIELLTLATYTGNTDPILALATFGSGGSHTQTSVIAASNLGSTVTQSAALADATGATTDGIVQLAANQSFIFAAVRPNAGAPSTVFPNADSGIALVQIVSSELELETKIASTGIAGNQAAPLDVNSDAIKITTAPTIPAGSENAVTLFWDDQLQRLYVGLSLQTVANAGDGAKSVAVGYLNASNALLFESFLPNAALNGGGDINHIVAAVSGGTTVNAEAMHVQTMHTSTGASYLIVHGGSFDPTATPAVTNTIYAVPLVDVNDPTNLQQGLLANKNSFNPVTHRFETIASVNGDLTTSSDPAAVVGASSLPFTVDPLRTISAMQVIGDTVYISCSFSPGTDVTTGTASDSGIFYSQAVFDEFGKIVRWSPWTKRVLPLTAFSSALEGAAFCAVDPRSGCTWAVDGATQQIVRVTTWQTGIENTTGLLTRLDNALFNSCSSVLDLDQSTQGFSGTNAPKARFALFGGANKIAFAKISEAIVTANPPFDTVVINSPQTVIFDFTQAENFLLTFLPGHAGAVTVMEYTRQSPGTATNYFFAGTDQGLYVFTDSLGNGFDAATLSNVSTAPFTGRTWKKITQIPGSIIDIKTLGNRLYIVSFVTENNSSKTVVYSVPITTNITTMFAAPEILAQTNTTPTFAGTAAFYALGIISTNATGTTEQLILATNTGVYQSTIAGGIQQPATTQTTAGWMQINSNFYTEIASTNTVWHLQIDGNDVTSKATLWPISLQDAHGLKTFERSSIDQLNGTTDASPFKLVPSFFNSSETTNPLFTTIPKSMYFWTDGCRRFFITNKPEDDTVRSTLMTFPYNTIQFNIAQPEQQIIDHPVLNEMSRIYWIAPIGVTGLCMAGTESGVVALQ